MISIIKKIIHKAHNESIGYAALVVSIFGLLSRILGFLKERILIYYYGVGDTLDIYNAAFKLPDFIFEILVAGALGASLIPVFSDILASSNKDVKKAWRCANGVFMVLVTVFTFLAIMGIIFAPQLIHVIVPGFPKEKMAQTVNLTRIMLLSPIFFSASAVLGNFLISIKKLVVYSTAPLFYNIGIILGIVFIAPKIGTIGLAAGVIFGAFLYFMIYFLTLSYLDFRLDFSFNVLNKNYDTLRVFKLMIPRFFSSASNQISLYFITFFSSTLAAGSLTIFNLADKIQTAVIGLIGFPFALATFTILTEAYSQGNYTKFSYVFSKTMRRILYFVIPLSTTLYILREPVIRIAYGTRNFNFEDTRLTASVLGILCVSLFAQSLIPLLARGFFAMQDTKTPLYVALFSQGLNITIIVSLLQNHKLSAIAIAYSATAIFNAFALFVILTKKNEDLKYFKVLETLFKIAFASGVSAITVYFTRNFISDQLSLQFVWQVFLQLTVSTGVGAVCYLFITAMLKMDEFETIRKKLIIRIFGEPQVATEEQNTVF